MSASQAEPVLFIVDVQQENNNRWGGRITYPIMRLQYRYRHVRFSLFRSSLDAPNPQTPFQPAPHARISARDELSAASAIADLIGNTEAHVHIASADASRSLIRTAYDLVGHRCAITFLAPHCAANSSSACSNAARYVIADILPSAKISRDTQVIPELIPELLHAETHPRQQPRRNTPQTPNPSPEEIDWLENELLQATHPKGFNARTMALLLLQTGESIASVTQRMHTNDTVVYNAAHRAQAEGVVKAAYGNKEDYNARKLAGVPGETLIEIAQSPAPDGGRLWTATMLSQELEERGVVDTITPEAVRHHLQVNNVPYRPGRNHHSPQPQKAPALSVS